MPEPEQSPKLRVPDVAKRYGVTERHVRSLVFERKIPHYKIGSKYRGVLLFDQDELDEWFEAQRVQTEAI